MLDGEKEIAVNQYQLLFKHIKKIQLDKYYKVALLITFSNSLSMSNMVPLFSRLLMCPFGGLWTLALAFLVKVYDLV